MMLENECHAEASGGRRMEWARGQGTEGAACRNICLGQRE